MRKPVKNPTANSSRSDLSTITPINANKAKSGPGGRLGAIKKKEET